MEKGTRVPCNARMADGAIRGGFVGFLWAGFYAPGEYASLLESMPHAAPPRALPFALRYGAMSVLSFSAFFGAYSGLLCRAESTLGSESLGSSVIAGGAMGCAIGACLPPRLPNALMIGSMTALVSGATAALVQQRR